MCNQYWLAQNSTYVRPSGSCLRTASSRGVSVVCRNRVKPGAPDYEVTIRHQPRMLQNSEGFEHSSSIPDQIKNSVNEIQVWTNLYYLHHAAENIFLCKKQKKNCIIGSIVSLQRHWGAFLSSRMRNSWSWPDDLLRDPDFICKGLSTSSKMPRKSGIITSRLLAKLLRINYPE